MRRLTNPDGVVTHLAWSPSGAELAMVVAGRNSHSNFLTLGSLIGELLIADLDGTIRSLDSNDWFEEIFWTSDGSKVGFIALPGAEFARQFQLWTIDRTGGVRETCTPPLEFVPGNNVQFNSPSMYSRSKVCARADGSLIVAGSIGPATLPWLVNMEEPGAAKPLARGERTCRPLDCHADKLLMSSQGFFDPPTLMIVDVATGDEKELLDPNYEWRKEINYPTVQHLQLETDDGTVDGWIFEPPELEPPHKTVLYIHGGPFMTFGYSYQEDFLELVGSGYAVAFANPRGSTGYGDRFSAPIVGRWGDLEFVDLNAFIDTAVANGIADPQQLAVTGYSGGGYLAAWLISQTTRFRAAIAEQGIYNMASMYGVSDASAYIAYIMGGEPHERPEEYWHRSAIAHARKVTTPTLLIQGTKDLRCPMEQAEQYFTYLRSAGCYAEMIPLENCYHTAEIAGSLALRRQRMDAIKEWLGRFL
jgi:dipeptidyl aminopeptidase/acylaminoacyl peptidase